MQPTIDELYEVLKPIRAEQILWHACQHIDVFATGTFPHPEKGDVDAIEILRAARDYTLRALRDEVQALADELQKIADGLLI